MGQLQIQSLAYPNSGNNVGFIGKISDDDLGNKYEEGLKKENVKYFYSKKKKNYQQVLV